MVRKSFFESTGIKALEGKIFEKDESGKIMIGYDYEYAKLFDKPVKVGSKLIINGKSFEVGGVVSKIGNPSDDQNIYMALTDFKELFNLAGDITTSSSSLAIEIKKFQDATFNNKDCRIVKDSSGNSFSSPISINRFRFILLEDGSYSNYYTIRRKAGYVVEGMYWSNGMCYQVREDKSEDFAIYQKVLFLDSLTKNLYQYP